MAPIKATFAIAYCAWNTRFTLVEDFQRLAVEQGQQFEDAVETVFQIANCRIIERKFRDSISGEEIDHIIRTPAGHEVWVESKGSWRGDRPGLRRSDTAKKAVATAWNLRTSHNFETPPYLLVTSHLPRDCTYSSCLLRNAVDHHLFREVLQYNDTPAAIERIDADLS